MKNHLKSILLASMLLLSVAPMTAQCNWSTKNVKVASYDTCTFNKQLIGWAYKPGGGDLDSCYKYTWTLNGIVVGSYPEIFYDITHDDTYNLCLKISDTCNNCDTTYCHTIITHCFLGTQNLERLNNAISIYPNPVGNELNISRMDGNIGSIIITDLAGREIYKLQRANQQSSLNVSSIPRGMYFLQVLSENHIKYVTTFIKN